jgi:type II secretory pathway component GspD/PulD (secretin)
VITLNYLSQVLAKPGIVANTLGGPNGGFGPMGFLNADGLSAVLSFLNASSDAQVVSTPRVVTLDNETAMIDVSEGYPVFNVAAGTANTAGGSSVSYTNVGTLLTVTPRISANDTVWLHILPVVSSYAGLASETVGGQTYQAPQFETRSFETRVVVPNAHTLVMGGLVQDSPASTSTKVPLLGDIPGLGYLFRSDSKSDNKDNLLIFITPTIVKDDDFHSTDTQFFSTKPNKRPTIIDPNNLWQGTRPYNWSNPTNTDPAQAIIDEPSVQ